MLHPKLHAEQSIREDRGSGSTWLMTVKPMFAVDGKALGMSCIMHSNLVGLLKAVLLVSLYFGLTNSAMMPLVSCRAAA